MIRLIFSDLRDHAATWIGAFAIAMTCGYIGGWAAALQATANFYLSDPSLYKSLQNTVSMVLVFSSIAAVAVLVSTAGLTVSAQRRSYALWQLANVRPRQVSTVVLVQLIIVAILGAFCGTLLVAATFAPLFPLVFRLWEPFSRVIPQIDASYMPLVWFTIAGVFVLGGLKGARDAGRTPPLFALHSPEQAHRGMTWVRVVLFCLLAAGTGAVAYIMVHTEPKAVMNWSLYVPLLVVTLLVPLTPLVCSSLLGVWTSLVPQNRWNAWFLARHTARFGLSVSTSVETPIMVGFGLIASLFSIMKLWETYLLRQGINNFNGLDPTQTVLVLGGPVLLCAIGAAISVVMTSRSRTRDVALLIANGAKQKTLLAAVACEAFIHTTTATLVGMIGAVLSNLIIASAVDMPPLANMAFGEGLVVSLAGFILVLVATLIPTLSALNKEIAAVLTVQE